MSSIAFTTTIRGSNGAGAGTGIAGTRTPAGASRLRITRRGRTVLSVLVAVPLAVAAATFGLGAAGASAGTHSGSVSTFQYVTVDPGESLWQLAQSVAPSADPRDVIADILTLNNLSSAAVQPGQRLAIPTQYSK